MTRQELIEYCNNLAAEIQNSSNDKKILTLFEELTEASATVVTCVPGAEVNVVPFVIADSKGINPIPVMEKARNAAKRAGKTDIAGKIDSSLDIFEPHYYRNIMPKQEREKLLLNLVAKIENKKSTPQEIVDAFDKITSINTGFLMSQRYYFDYSATGNYLNRIGGIDIDSVFEKAEEAFAKLGDKKKVKDIKKGYYCYFQKFNMREQASRITELYSKIENKKSTPQEVRKAFKKMMVLTYLGGEIDDSSAYNIVDAIRRMPRMINGFNADFFFDKVEKSCREIGDEQTVKDIQKLRKIYKE